MNTIFTPLPSTDAVRPASADQADVRLAACAAVVCVAILLTNCLEVSVVVLVVVKRVAVVTIYLAEVPPRRLHGDAASRDTS